MSNDKEISQDEIRNLLKKCGLIELFIEEKVDLLIKSTDILIAQVEQLKNRPAYVIETDVKEAKEGNCDQLHCIETKEELFRKIYQMYTGKLTLEEILDKCNQTWERHMKANHDTNNNTQ